jgi:hypothetical protein
MTMSERGLQRLFRASRVLVVAATAGAVLVGCATTAPFVTGPVEGAMSFARNDYREGTGVFWSNRVAFGPRDGPAYSSLDLAPDGTWNGNVSGTEFPIRLTVTADRFTGPGIDVRITRFPGGFRLTGLWIGAGVDLTLDGQRITIPRASWPLESPCVYVPQGYMGRFTVTFEGAACRVADPPWPHLPILLLMSGLGLRDVTAG